MTDPKTADRDQALSAPTAESADPLHPDGRCSCGGGGECEWCKTHCPSCGSPDPKLHPSVQHEGECRICRDPWHRPTAESGKDSEPTDPSAGLRVSSGLTDGVAPVVENTGQLAGAVEATAGETQTIEQALNLYVPKPGECICWRCLDGKNYGGMVLCSQCGNKRCPKANDHDNECSGSNEPGQPGSAYADQLAPVAEAPERVTREDASPPDWDADFYNAENLLFDSRDHECLRTLMKVIARKLNLETRL